MPTWLWEAMRAAVRMSGNTALYNEDDVETLCLLVLFAACCATTALAFHIIVVIVSHIRKRRMRSFQ
jgi:hypothetical protein